ncbi:MAG: MbnP family protein [Ferruginibacter sp.]
MKKIIFNLTTIASLFLASSSFTHKPKPSNAKLVLHFHNMVDDKPLLLNDSMHVYHNENGDDFYVTTFKYYISNIVLTKKNGEQIRMPESYFLVNAADSTTLTQELTGVPPGKYSGISFTIGVDSLRNFAGAQTGCLDPARGMFWTWKSGYIFVKLEGVSSKSPSKKNRLVYHIGGAIAPENNIRIFNSELPNTLKIKENGQPQIDLSVNAASLFKGSTTVNFANLSGTMGGPKSIIIADNYAKGLFTITSVKK